MYLSHKYSSILKKRALFNATILVGTMVSLYSVEAVTYTVDDLTRFHSMYRTKFESINTATRAIANYQNLSNTVDKSYTYTQADIGENINLVVANTFGDTSNGNVNLTLAGTSSVPITIDVTKGNALSGGVVGNYSSVIDSDSEYNDIKNWYYSNIRGNADEHSVLPRTDPESDNWVGLIKGNLNMTLNWTTVFGDVIGTNYYTALNNDTSGSDPVEVDSSIEMGVKGKTTITLNNSIIKGDIRGVNGNAANTGISEAASTFFANEAKFGDFEININNSIVEDEVFAVWHYISAGNITINVTGNSSIGYLAGTDEKKLVKMDGLLLVHRN